jgi:Bax protein
VLPSLIRFAELFSPELFRDREERDEEPVFVRTDEAPASPLLTAEDRSRPVPSFLAPAAVPRPNSPQSAAIDAAIMKNPKERPPPALDRERPATRGRPLLSRALRTAATVVFVLAGAASMGGVTVRSVGLVSEPAIVTAALPPESGFAPEAVAPPVDHLHWWTLREAFDRIGFDLDSVAAGSAPVPRVALAMLPNDLDGIDDLDARKDLFLRSFLPVVLTVNEHILDDRKQLIALRTKIATGGTLLGGEVQWLLGLADTYDQPDLDFDTLLKKVDAIPPSLALAQAIEESGWGTSRIAKGQNAMFGQFGDDPLRGWDYRSFDTLTAAVESYARNLNTHRAYREFRQARSTMRAHGGTMDAFALAATLFRYSERGPHYVKDLRWIMRDNDLRAFDSAHLDVGEKVAVIASNDDARDIELPRP